MPSTVLTQAPRVCPWCGGEKLLRHSRMCGYCYEMATWGWRTRASREEPPVTEELSLAQWADFQLGVGLAASLGVLSCGAGTSAAAWVLVATGGGAIPLAGAVLAFLGGGGITFGSLTSLLLLYLRARRPYAVLGLTDSLLRGPWRRAHTLWHKFRRWSGADPADPLFQEEEEWP